MSNKKNKNIQQEQDIKRMNDLINKMDNNPAEFYKEEENKNDENKDHLKEEREKFKKLSLYREDMSTSSMNGTYGSYPLGGFGETVNSVVDNQDGSQHPKYGYDDDKAKPAVTANISSKEALSIAINRALESGDPVNNISFYDEINWNLEKMGFPSFSPLSIKNAISELIKDGTIHNKNI